MTFTAERPPEEEWIGAFFPEVPEANGQGRTEAEALASLHAASDLFFDDRLGDPRRSPWLPRRSALWI